MAQDNLQSQSEQEIQFKKRARRRLVGAVALVLLMIVLLPMLLEDKLSSGQKEDVVISIPSQDSQLGQDGQLEAKVESEPVKSAGAIQDNIAPVPEANTPAQASSPTNEIKPVDSTVPVAQNDKSLSKPNELSSTQEVQAPNKEEPKPKATDLANKTEKPVASGNYFVQIGVFSDPENVKQLQAKLSDKGLKSRSELIDTAKGKKTRLRVGPLSSKKDAEATLVKVKALELTGVVVAN